MTDASTTTIDLEFCAREPIHVPGSVQPHGVLFALREDGFEVVQVSANVTDFFGVSVEEVLGCSFSEWLSVEDLQSLTLALTGDLAAANPLMLTLALGKTHVPVDAIVHRSGTTLVIEVERRGDVELTFQSSYYAIRSSVTSLNATGSLAALAQATAEEVRKLTAFDRVMIYRFDRDWNGEVIAEDKRDDLEPFLGLHYPATDIPAQARALYTRNWLRLIPDARYEPSMLVPQQNPLDGASLDLSESVLRSVSPVHCEYLANMGVVASMSISLIDRGKLWGLVACHHYAGPHHVPYVVRAAAEFLGQTASLLLAAKEDSDTYESALMVRSIQTQLLETLAREDGDIATALTYFQPTVADLVGATGAILSLRGERSSVGLTPADGDLDRLSAWIFKQSGDVFATDSLAGLDEQFRSVADVASGVLAVPLSQRKDSWIMWFRPEQPQQVTWAGDPRTKIVHETDDGVRLSPRKSFASWTEDVRGRSVPWTDHEVRAAGELGRRLTSQLLRHMQDQADAAQVMQEGLTLNELPVVPGLEFSTLYRPGDGGMVGGDWFDIVPLRDGRVAVTIGDVAGHGVMAAATMGQLRSSLRAYLVEETQPGGILGALNRLVHWLLPNDLATGVVAIYDPSSRLLRMSSAGHLPPLLVRRASGSYLQIVRAPALGISEQVRYAESAFTLEVGDSIVLYTDGLVESRSEPLDAGFARLAAAAQDVPPLELRDHLLETMRREGMNDDVAILVMKVTA